MRHIQLRDAKSGLSRIVDDAAGGTPSTITRRGKPEVVIVGVEEWTRLNDAAVAFGAFLLQAPFTDEDLPPRTSDARPLEL